MHPDKKSLRISMVIKRNAMSPVEVREKSASVRERLLSLEPVTESTCFLLYLPIKNEVDTWPLLQMLLQKGKEVFAPCCRPWQTGRMDFFRVQDRSELRPGFCGIPEPRPAKENIFRNHVSSVAIVPGVAFDELRYRLGFGQGFYDRYFSSLSGPELLLTGLAYEFQIVDRLPADPWDVPMQFVVTEERVVAGSTEYSS